MTNPVQRRIFLRGLGGAVVAAPFLSSLADRAAKAQATTPATPQRLILMVTMYGCVTNRFFPKKSHGPLTAEDLASTSLASLAPHVSKLLIPRGIRAMNEWTASLSRGQGNDPHTQVTGSMLTCQPVTPNSDDPFSFSAATKVNALPMDRSIDHIIAEQLSPSTEPLYVRVGNVGESNIGGISYAGKGAKQKYPGLGQPQQIWSAISGLFKDGQPMNPDTWAAIKGKSIVDLVKDDLDTLERFDLGQSDKLKLAAWKELLSSTGQVVASAMCSEELGAMIGATKANVDAIGTGGVNVDVLTAKVAGELDTADIFSNLAVLGALCGYSPVTILKYPGQYVFRGLGLNSENHGLSHRIGDAGMQGTCVGGVLDMLTKIDVFYAQKFAHLVATLDSVSEGDGKTLLVNTATVWMQEMSDGNAHNLNNIPIIQAGNAGGYFKQGQAVNVEDGTDGMTLGRSDALCAEGTSNMVNGTTQSTGTEATKCNAPVNKYFVSLMQALGIKAGEDGFPKAGGAAEVTHFGMYDKTEDFVGGGTKPAKINDPGPFDALKATP
jgi:hypothetical protein